MCIAAVILLAHGAMCTVEIPEALQSIPTEILDEAARAHPEMRKLLQIQDTIPQQQNRTGTSYACVSQHEYKAAAMNKAYAINSEHYQYSDGTFFCEDYVDYAAVCDQNNPARSCNNLYAYEMNKNFERALKVYSCKQYSRIWTCQNCLAAYKRWLCSQIYRKYLLPDTDYVEEGLARDDSPVCSCTGKQPIDNRDCVRICNGMPDGCIVDIAVVTDECWQPTCGGGENGVGSSVRPGLCAGYVFLDPTTASSQDGFYIGAKIEMLEGQMQGWWAEIQEYSGFAKVALFQQWVPPKSKETEQPLGAKLDDPYRIYFTERQRGHCRNFSNPLKRLGPPCEQSPVFEPNLQESTGRPLVPTITDPSGNMFCPDGTPYNAERCGTAGGFSFPSLPYRYPLPGILGGTRCADDEKCIAIPRAGPTQPLASPTGFACCKKSGYEIVPLLGEFHKVYSLLDTNTNVSTGFLNYTCVRQEGNNYATVLIEAEKKIEGPAPFSQPAIEASGCFRNFGATSEKAVDDCALRTCSPVCNDVVRRCPRHIEFSCPESGDTREYEATYCNMVVPHGCLLQVRSGTSAQTCVQLNPKGTGPLDDPGMLSRGFMAGSGIMGLPQEPRCYGFRGISIDNGAKNPPTPPEAEKGNTSFDFDTWCPDAADPELQVREPLDENCREMRFTGFYQDACYPQP